MMADATKIACAIAAITAGAVLGSAVVWLPASLGYKPWVVSGSSMRDTLYGNDLAYSRPGATPKTEDIVIATAPAAWGLDREDLVKRVVAEPGDTVTIDSTGRLHAGGDADSPLVDSREKQWSSECPSMLGDADGETITLGRDEWLLRGDNVNNSSDSRWAWCRGESPVVETSQIKAVVEHVVPVGKALSKIIPTGD